MSGLEIERKFLVRGEDYRRQATSKSRIKQGYIMSRNGRTVRVRVRDDRGFLTIKGPSQNGGLSRYEFASPDGQHTFEVDEFYGDNAGLVMAEVELKNEGEPFKKPDFIGDEVTGDRRFYNAHMRQMPFIVWRGTIPTEFRHIELESST